MTTLTSTHCGVHQLIADVTLMCENNILMMRTRSGVVSEDHDGWYLPDDYVGDLEHPDSAARRILEEQTNVSVDSVRLSHFDSFVAGDGTWNLAFHYTAHVEAVEDVGTDDSLEFHWFNMADMPEPSEVSNFGRPLAVINRTAKSATEQLIKL
jgi:ADP-ribose pyrophosphatase YjhB (NUDIX family)